MPGVAVAIIDDDAEVREALGELLDVTGFRAVTFASAAAFLARYRPGLFGCLITDIKMPGIDGLELQDRLNAMGSGLPVIILTSVADERVRSRAMQSGAHAFLQKPVAEQAMLASLTTALCGRGLGPGDGPPHDAADGA